MVEFRLAMRAYCGLVVYTVQRLYRLFLHLHKLLSWPMLDLSLSMTGSCASKSLCISGVNDSRSVVQPRTRTQTQTPRLPHIHSSLTTISHGIRILPTRRQHYVRALPLNDGNSWSVLTAPTASPVEVWLLRQRRF